jgi:hypothetical protein
VETTNPTPSCDGDGSKVRGKMSIHKIDNEEFNNLIKCLNVGQCELLYHTYYLCFKTTIIG